MIDLSRQSRKDRRSRIEKFSNNATWIVHLQAANRIKQIPQFEEICSKTLTRRFSPDLLVVVVVVVVWAGGCPASWGTCCAGGVAPTVTPPVGIVAPTPVTIVQQQVFFITKLSTRSTRIRQTVRRHNLSSCSLLHCTGNPKE